MTYALLHDDDNHSVEMAAFSFPRIARNLTVEQAAAIWAEVEANEACPDRIKDGIGGRLNQRLDEVAGRSQPPQPVVASIGVGFCGASADEVERALKELAKAARR